MNSNPPRSALTLEEIRVVSPALEQYTRTKYAQAALTAYRSVQPTTTFTVKALREWAPHVARFSFRSGRL